MSLGCFRCDLNFLISCIRATIGNIVSHGSRKQDRFLRCYGNIRKNRILFDLADIDPIDQDPAFRDFIKTGDQIYKG